MSLTYEARVLVFPKRRLEYSCLSRANEPFFLAFCFFVRSSCFGLPEAPFGVFLYLTYEARVLVFPKRRLESPCLSRVNEPFFLAFCFFVRSSCFGLPEAPFGVFLYLTYEARVLVFPKRRLESSCLSRVNEPFFLAFCFFVRSSCFGLPEAPFGVFLSLTYESRVLVFPKRRLEYSCLSRVNELFFLPSASSYEARVLVFPKRRLESSCTSRTKLVFWSSRSAVWSLPVSHESMNLFFLPSASSYLRSSCFGLPEAQFGVFLSLTYEARVLVFPKRRLESSCLSRVNEPFFLAFCFLVRSSCFGLPEAPFGVFLSLTYESRVLVFPKRRLESSCLSRVNEPFFLAFCFFVRSSCFGLPEAQFGVFLSLTYEARVLVFPKRRLESSCLSRVNEPFFLAFCFFVRSSCFGLPEAPFGVFLYLTYESRVLVFPKRRLESSCLSRVNELFFLPSASSYEARVLVFPKRRLESSCLSRTKLVFWSSRSAVWSLPVSHESRSFFSCLLLLLTKLVFWSSRSAVWSFLVSHVRSSCFGLPEAPSGVFLSLASQ